MEVLIVPPILRLPNEVLLDIFSHLSTSLADSDEEEGLRLSDHEPPTVTRQSPLHPILILRQVCRRFRAVANELNFWSNEDFDFSKLVGHPGQAYTIPGIVEALLTDSHLVKCFEKKRTWLFRSYDVFCIVMARVPLLQRVATAMKFIWASYEFESDFILDRENTLFRSLVDKLAVFTRLTSLQLLEVPELDFDNIPKYLPALEILNVNYRWHQLDRPWVGSLQGLTKLRQLSLINIGESLRRWSTVAKTVVDPLPLSSAPTLTHLQIIGWNQKEIRYIVHSLGTFINLTFLSLGPLSAELASSIARVNLRLKDFQMRVSGFGTDDPEDTLRILFSAPCLVGLQSLSFSYLGDGSWYQPPTYFATVNEIIVNLATLQHLTLRMQMYKSMCRAFDRLVNLKSITWVVPRFFDDQTTEIDYRDEETVVKGEFEITFRTFAEKPTLNIAIEEWYDYDDDYRGEFLDDSD